MKATPTEQKTLLSLQDVDTSLTRIAHQAKSLAQHAQLTALGGTLDEIRRRYAAVAGERDDIATELSRTESDVAVVEARIKRDNQRLEVSTSVKDIAALEGELTSLKTRRSILEDIELAVMERLEEKNAQLAEIDAEREGVAAQISATEFERDQALDGLTEARRGLESNRSAIAGGISSELLELYEKRRAAGGGVGAALLRARSCGGCTMGITGNDLEAVRNTAEDQVVFCPDCGRILVRTEESGISPHL